MVIEIPPHDCCFPAVLVSLSSPKVCCALVVTVQYTAVTGVCIIFWHQCISKPKLHGVEHNRIKAHSCQDITPPPIISWLFFGGKESTSVSPPTLSAPQHTIFCLFGPLHLPLGDVNDGAIDSQELMNGGTVMTQRIFHSGSCHY